MRVALTRIATGEYEVTRMTDFWLAASAIGTILLAVAALAALGATIWQVRMNEREFRESRQQVQDNLEASQRPYLHPFGSLEVNLSTDGNLSFEFSHQDPGQSVKVKNSGAGIAFNVRGAVVQHRPRVKTELRHPPQVRSIVVDDPLSVGDDAEPLSRGGPFQFGWDTTVGSDPDDTLAAPEDTIARLTLTYQDVFGNTHASQFDYTNRGVTGPRWVFHRFLPKVPHDLEALARQHDFQNLRNQTAFLNERAANTLGS
jgi:hypothetical protein